MLLRSLTFSGAVAIFEHIEYSQCGVIIVFWGMAGIPAGIFEDDTAASRYGTGVSGAGGNAAGGNDQGLPVGLTSFLYPATLRAYGAFI